MEGMVLMMLYIIIAVSFWYYPVRLGLLPRLFLNCADQRVVRLIGINHCDIIRLSRFIQRHRLKKKKNLISMFSMCSIKNFIVPILFSNASL